MHTYPENHFEIVNLSLTAVNSYTVLGFAKELADYEPDAVLIYTGQNEYYGGLGVASAQTIGNSPALVNLLLRTRDSRVVQLILNSFLKIKRPAMLDEANDGMTRMEFMVGKQQIPYQSQLYEKGLNQFRYNMDAALQALSKNNIPVFFSNLVCNIKDIPPFIGENGANDIYAAAQLLWKEGKYDEARDNFLKAKELDELRFRAPEELNVIIEELCRKYPQTYLVNASEEMKKQVPHEVLGDELFTDHVHPNLKGYALMANAFYQAMKESRFLPEAKEEITEDAVFREMPVSPIDSLAGMFRIMRLKSHWPYNNKEFDRPIPERTVEEKLAAQIFRKEENWLAAHNALYLAYTNAGQPEKAVRVAEGAVLEYPEDPAFYDKAAMDFGKSGQIEQAAFYLQKSFDLSKSFEKAHYLFVYFLMMDAPSQALPVLNYAIENNTGQLKLEPVKSLVQQVIALKQKLSADERNVAILNEIAKAYLQMGNTTVSLQYVEKVLSIDSQNPEALQLKDQRK